MRMYLLVAAATAALMLGGCATSRSEIKIEPQKPTPAASAGSPAARGVVLIKAVTDERVFENAPKDPSVPSLGHEGSDAASADVKARAIARKRNGYGKAMGEVLLQSGQTVVDVVRAAVVGAFEDAGYAVVEDASNSAAIPVDVQIKQCWAWFRPGFFQASINVNIETDVALGARTIDVTTQHSKGIQMGTDSNWVEALTEALAEYRASLSAKLTAAP